MASKGDVKFTVITISKEEQKERDIKNAALMIRTAPSFDSSVFQLKEFLKEYDK